MTWCSASAIAIAAVAALGCRQAETPIEVRVMPPCAVANQTVNTFVATLFATTRERLNQPCTECSQGQCTTIAEVCTCSDEPVPAATSILGPQLAGLRYEDVDTDLYYCVRVVALDIPGNVGDGCPCEAWRQSQAGAQICAFSTVGVINDADAPLTVSLAACAPNIPAGCLTAGE